MVSKRNRISVVIPCYNDGKYLPETLESLAAQTRPADEILVVNDGSTDPATLALFDQLPKHIRVHHQHNQGLGFARNNGIRETTGDLILALDSDDLITPDTLEKMEAALDANPEASFVYSQIESFGAWQDFIPVPRWNPYLELDNNYCVVMSLIRKSVFTEKGLYYPKMLGYEDWSFWLGCIEAGLHGVVIDEPLFKYRRKVTGSLLTASDRVRHELKTLLMQQHPKLFTPEMRATLKLRHAPGLELVWTGPATDVPRVRAWLARQTLTDVTLTVGAPGDARGLLEVLKGKYAALLRPEHLPLLERGSPTFLEQVVRASETRYVPAIVVPTDVTTLTTWSTRHRVENYPTERLGTHPGDIIFLRTWLASRATGAELPAGKPAMEVFHEVVRTQGALLFAQDFFHQVKQLLPGQVGVHNQAPQRSPIVQKARKAVSIARRGVVKVLGEDQTARLLHPIKVGLHERREALKRLVPSQIQAQIQRQVRHWRPDNQPLLRASHIQERLLLDGVPVDFERPMPLVTAGDQKRVLLMLPWAMCGGVDKATIDMAELLRGAGYELALATNIPSTNDWAHKLVPHVDDVWHMQNFVPAADQVGVVTELVRNRGYDAVFMSHSWLGYDTAMAVKRRLPGVRTVDFLHMHNDYTRQSCKRYDRFLDMHLVSSEFISQRAQRYGVDPSKLRVIRLTCDEENLFNPDKVAEGWLCERLRLRRGTPVVGFVGRLHQDKDPLFLARVHEKMRSRWSQPNRPLNFVFIGDGPMEQPLRTLLHDTGMNRCTHILPSDTPIAMAMRDMSLLMLASRVEGLPIVFYEALSMGVPVVSTAIEGIPELVTSEVGACVPNLKNPEKRLERVTSAALDILEDENLRADMGRRARQRMQTHFSLATTHAAYLKAFEELLRTGSTPVELAVAG
ncbi:glycosyltransferase [Archangium lipolyticum]|uniref:glycosyltransferase n=1 Tax=Archangium lipolyticum TaxID=2970465 RepID=UPI00214A32E6|nr:glycosyltransferase [Archangium lipolyticum]